MAAAQWGCATEERLPAADRSTPATYRNQAPGTELPRPSSEWWRELGSIELDRLEEMALANNRDLQVAIARVAQAHAQAGVADAARYPTVSLFGRREAYAPDDGAGSAATRSEWHTQQLYQLGVRANYEIDIWGRYGYAVESALALAKASVHQREAVALTLTADVAAAYMEWLSLNDRIATSERSLENRRNSLKTVSQRLRLGDATTLESAQQRVAVASAESTTVSLVQRRERAFNRLAVLAGVAPAELRLEARGLNGMPVPGIKAGLPSDLLCRRPDIRRLEAQLAAAQFDVQSLRASLLPSFSLFGEIGYGAWHLTAMSNPASLFFLAAARASHTIIDGGQRDQQLDGARARHLELLHQYSGGLLTALREVEDALAAARLTEEQQRALTEAAEASRTSYGLSQRFFAIGAVDYPAVLDAEQKLVASEDALESALHDRMRAAIDLYRALGGGTQAGADPCAR